MYIRLFILTIILFSSTACAPSAGQEVASGNQAFAEADFVSAADSYQAATELSPVQAEPLYNLANTRYRQGIYTDTHQLLPQVASIGSEEIAAQSYFNKGNAHYQLADWEAAIESYKETLRIHPDDAEAKYNLELAMRNIAQQQEQEQQDQENQEEQDQDQEQQQDQQQENGQGEQENQEQQDQQQQEQQNQPGEDEQPEEPQENQEQTADNSESQEEADPAQAQPSESAKPQEGLTPEQARQLLRAVGQNTETLQEQMQLVLPSEGAPPEKDW